MSTPPSTTSSGEPGLESRPHDEREKTPWLVAIFCLVVMVIPTVSVLPGPLRGNGSPARLIGFLCFALITLAFFVPRRPRRGRGAVNPGAILILTYFFLLLLTFGIGLLDKGNDVIESSKIRTLLVLIADVGIALYTIHTVRTLRARTFVLGFLVVGLTWACIVAVIQSFTGLDYRFALVPPGLVQLQEATELSTRQGALRVVGTSDHAIEFGVVAAVAVPLTFHFARFGSTGLQRQLAAISCVIAFVAVPAAVSRSGALALAVIFVVYIFAFRVRLVGNVIIVAAAALLALKIVNPRSINALWATFLGSENDSSVLTRTEDYAAVGLQFRERPWFGLGLGGYPPTEFRFLDNQWLQAIVQGGVVGLAAMILISAAGIAGMTAALRKARCPRERDQIYAIGASFIGVLVSSITFDIFSFQQATYVFFILLALLWSGFDSDDTREHHLNDRLTGAQR